MQLEKGEALKAEGVIKFTIKNHRPGPPLAPEEFQDIEVVRAALWQLKLIGQDEQAGVGYGNISRRRGGGFVISGTQTGHKETLDGGDYVVVESWDFARNTVSCTGACLPSSESLSHAALYQRPEVAAVIHVHSRALWTSLIQAGAPSTEVNISYGSEALYRRLAQLAGSAVSPSDPNPLGVVPEEGLPGLPLVVVTKGHQDGVFVAAASLTQAYEALLGLAGK